MTFRDTFRFGLESELLLIDVPTGQPLWYTDVTFSGLNEILETIPIDDIRDLDGLELELPHRKLMPFVVEGYGIPVNAAEGDFRVTNVLPKGVEIRTPVCDSIGGCLSTYSLLLGRLNQALRKAGAATAALSHHPVAIEFKGPLNKRRHDWWQWAMEVMTTYGPDINVSLPSELAARVDLANPEELLARINHYGPAMTAFSAASPFRGGGIWKIRGEAGKSLRTYRRSVVAPPIEIHPDENGRLEFKLFDMTPSLQEFESQFLLFLALVLDERLEGRASNASRIYGLGEVARHGFEAEGIPERAGALLEAAHRSLPRHGFDPAGLAPFIRRFDSRRTPADDLIELHEELGQSIPAVLKRLSELGNGNS